MRSASSRPAVTCLGGLVRPPAVIRSVVAVVIDAVNGVTRARAKPHILEESLEAQPALADAYSSSAVIRVLRSIRVVTPRPHLSPGSVFWRLGSSGGSVKKPPLRHQFALETATATSLATGKKASQDRCFVPAFTSTKPQRLIVSGNPGSPNGRKSRESCARYINRLHTKQLPHSARGCQ